MKSYDTFQLARYDKVTSWGNAKWQDTHLLRNEIEEEACLIFIRHYLEIVMFAQAISQE